jgi:pimeloyl-[acyl-carrier protein] synthase
MIDFDPTDPEFRRAPHAFYRRLREESPVHLSSAGYWVCTRYDDVKALLNDRRFSNQFRGEAPADSGEPILDMTRRWFNFYDPPDHTRVRRLLSGFFIPPALERLRVSAQEIAAGLLDDVAEQGEMDVVTDLAYPLPILVMAELLGIPREDRGLLRPWLADLHAVFDLAPPPEAIARGRESCLAILDYFDRLAQERREHPADDILSRLVAADQADGISAEELRATCVLLLFAGYETTTSLISGGLAALLSRPEELRRLWREPALLETAIEEMLRLVSPTQYVMRRALEDFPLRECVIPREAVVRLILAAANRDPLVFPRPDELDIERHPNRHLALGQGLHFGIGGPLSKLNTTVAFRALMARFDGLFRSSPSQASDNVCLPSYDSLRVRFTLAGPK